MKIKVDKFLEVLNKVKPAVAKKEIIEQATHFIFTGDEVITYNDRICILEPFESDFKCSVPADLFLKVLSEMDSNEIDITIVKNEMIIKGRKVKSGLKVFVEQAINDIVDSMDFPDVDAWKKLPKDFLTAISLCVFSVSKDQGHAYLNCVLVSGNKVISSDDSRISMYEMKGKIKEGFFISENSVIDLLNFDVDVYYVGENWLYFSTKDGTIFCSRRIKNEIGEEKMLNSISYFDFKGIDLNLPEKMIDSVLTASILAKGDFDVDLTIDITIEDGKVKCKGQKDSGWIEIEQKIDFDHDPVKFVINPIFLKQILEESTLMRYGDDKGLFISDSFKHLISLVPNEE